MSFHRLQRINDEMTKEMCRIIRTVKDPRVTGGITTITGCEVTADLKYAKVFYSFLEELPPQEAEVRRREIKKGLISAQGYIRRELAASLNLRITPELTFIPDTSVEYGNNISRILNEIKKENEDE